MTKNEHFSHKKLKTYKELVEKYTSKLCEEIDAKIS